MTEMVSFKFTTIYGSKFLNLMALEVPFNTIKLRVKYPFISIKLKASHFVTPTEVGVHDFNYLKVEKMLFRQFKLWIPVFTGMTWWQAFGFVL